jgi:hypothetical protein
MFRMADRPLGTAVGQDFQFQITQISHGVKNAQARIVNDTEKILPELG